MQYLIILFATLVGTIFITPYFIELFNRIKIVDLPDGMRKLHSTPVPRMGGLLIFIVFLTSIFIFYGDINSIKYYLFGIIVVFALGAYDDLLGTGYLLKFIYQAFNPKEHNWITFCRTCLLILTVVNQLKQSGI